MPYSKSKLPEAALAHGEDGGASMAKEKETVKKSLVESIVSLIEKAFGDVSGEQQTETLKEEMVSYEVVYEPNVKDAHGEWMSEKTIQKACENFNRNLKKGVVQPNLFHIKDTDLFSIEDTWIQKELDVVVEATGEVIKAGTWVAKVKYHDPVLWELKKSGVIGGVSIGCKGVINPDTGEITDVSFDGE